MLGNMLIRLDVSLIALANSGEVGRGVVRDALNMLAIARKEGNHFIYGEIDVVKQLKKLPLLNELTYSILNRVLTRFSEKAAMHDRLSTSVIEEILLTFPLILWEKKQRSLFRSLK
jgi:hypothetical protein